MLNNIGDYLAKIKNLVNKEEDFIIYFCSSVQEVTGFKLEEKEVSFKGGKFTLKTNSYLKTEIALHKEEILKSLKEKFPNKTVLDIL